MRLERKMARRPVISILEFSILVFWQFIILVDYSKLAIC